MLLFVMRRVSETVHARHYEQYEREVQEARDGYYDEHLVGRVAHAGRRGVQQHVRGRRRGRCRRIGRRPQRVASVGRQQRGDVVVVPPVVRRAGYGAARTVVRGRPPIRRCHVLAVVLAVVSDRPPGFVADRAAVASTAANAAVLVVVHRSTATADHGVRESREIVRSKRVCEKKNTN